MYKAYSFVHNYSCIIYFHQPPRALTALFFFSFPRTSYLEKESTQMLKWLKFVPVSVLVAFGKLYCL